MFTHTPRQERVPFTRPVRVMTLDGQKPPMRLLSGNLSRGGMFLRSPLMLEAGTKVELSLEAKGMPLPLAEAEVVWQRDPATGAITLPGFGVRFTQFLHPRAEELVSSLIARKKDDEISGDVPAQPFEAPNFIPGDAHLANGSAGQEYLSPEAGVIPLSETDVQEIPDVQEEAAIPWSALRPMRSRVMGVGAFALLLALPIAVAVGTWRAVSSSDRSAIRANDLPAPQPAVTLIAAPTLPAPEQMEPVAAAPQNSPEPSTLAPAQVALSAKPAAAEPSHAAPAPMEVPSDALTDTPIEMQPQDPALRNEAKAIRPSAIGSAPVTVHLGAAAVPAIRAATRSGELHFDMELAKNSRIQRAFTLASPARVVVDISGAKPKASSIVSVKDVRGVRQVRVGALAEGTRLVIDFTRPVGVLVRDGQVLSVQLR